jgi:hypothetical protein
VVGRFPSEEAAGEWKMPEDRVAEYLEDAYKRLDRRKPVNRTPKKGKKGSASAQPDWGPTNEQVKTIMQELECNLTGSDSEDDEGYRNLIKMFCIHKVDLIEVAIATFWGKHRAHQIQAKATELRIKKAAEHKSQQRAKKLEEQDNKWTLSPKALSRFLAGFSRRQDIAQIKQQLGRLTSTFPNFPSVKTAPSTGRRQDLPVKIMQSELERFFARNHPNVQPSQRRQWVRRIVNASRLLPDEYSRKTFHKHTARLRQQIPSFPF